MRRPHRRILVLVVLLLASSAGASEAGSTAPGQQSPAAATAPAITGPPVQGQTLTGSTGSWTGVAVSYSYQWKRCDLSGSGCSSIAGATGGTYALGAADVATTVRLTVTGTNKNGSAAATSNQTPVIAPLPSAPPPPADTALPAISGSATVGSTL